MNKSRHAISLLFILPLGVFVFGCKSTELNCIWKDREIVIDGNHTDWKNTLTYIQKKDVSIGLMNDEKYLYICLVPTNLQVQDQMTRLGFTLWLDPKGGKNKTLGIHYPLGMTGSGMSPRDLGFGQRQGMGVTDTSRMRIQIEQSLSELEILGPEGGDVRRMGIDQIEGIDVEVGNFTGTFVYELKVPLMHDEEHPYAVGIENISSIGIGFETTEIDMQRMREGMLGRRGGMGGGGRDGGRMGGGRMGGGKRGGGMQRGGQPEMPKPLKVWIKAHLSEGTRPVSF